MSTYRTRREQAVGALALEYSVSAIYANELATAWEYEANRRSLNQRADEFWRLGRAWIEEELIRRKEEPAET